VHPRLLSPAISARAKISIKMACVRTVSLERRKWRKSLPALNPTKRKWWKKSNELNKMIKSQNRLSSNLRKKTKSMKVVYLHTIWSFPMISMKRTEVLTKSPKKQTYSFLNFHQSLKTRGLNSQTYKKTKPSAGSVRSYCWIQSCLSTRTSI
jgi:hypothetical protein